MLLALCVCVCERERERERAIIINLAVDEQCLNKCIETLLICKFFRQIVELDAREI